MTAHVAKLLAAKGLTCGNLPLAVYKYAAPHHLASELAPIVAAETTVESASGPAAAAAAAAAAGHPEAGPADGALRGCWDKIAWDLPKVSQVMARAHA